MSRPLEGQTCARAPRRFPSQTKLFQSVPSPQPEGLIKDEADTLIWREELEDGRRAIVKMYRHRSVFDFARERLSRFRVQREHEVLTRLFSARVPCCEPLAWAYGRAPEHGRYECLATVEIDGARTALELLSSQKGEHWDLAPLFRIVRRMHESGVFHGVLKLHNILVVPGRELAFYVIDTPRAVLYSGSIVGTRMAWFDLLRLSSDAARTLGWPASRLPLEEYGLDEADRRTCLSHLQHFDPTKLVRARIRVCAVLSRFGKGYASAARRA